MLHAIDHIHTVPVIVSKRHQQVLVPMTDALKSVWRTQAKSVNWKGNDYYVFPHNATYASALARMGTPVPSVISTYYDWPGHQSPFHAQKVTADMLTMHKRAYVLSDIGVGKTRSALFAADFLMQQGLVRKCLVVCPLSTITSVWEHEVMSVMPYRDTVSLHHTTKKRRIAQLEQDADFYVINHDGLKVMEHELRKRKDIDCVIIDELDTFKNPSTERWKVAKRVIDSRTFVWGMTGSPIPNGPEDAYGQAKLLTPDRVPNSAKQWRNKTMFKVATFVWVAKKDALDTVYEAMKPAVRFTRDECLDLPDRMTKTLNVGMAPRQKKIYDALKDKYKVKLLEGEVKAVNEGVLISKLLQVSCGFVYTVGKGEVDLQNQERLDVLKSIITHARHKVIVFAPFVFAVGMLAKEVSQYANIGVVHGGVNKTKRDDIFIRFQHGSEMKVLVAHPGCMSHGLTLTSSNIIVWYSPIQSPRIYEQANGRITRAGQVNKQYVVHISGSKVEDKTYARLMRKQRTQGLLLEMFKGVETDG